MSARRVTLEIEVLQSRDLPSVTTVTPVIHDLPGDVQQLETAATTFQTEVNQTVATMLTDLANAQMVGFTAAGMTPLKADFTDLKNEITTLETAVRGTTIDMLQDSRMTPALRTLIGEIREASSNEIQRAMSGRGNFAIYVSDEMPNAASQVAGHLIYQADQYAAVIEKLTTKLSTDLTKLGIS